MTAPPDTPRRGGGRRPRYGCGGRARWGRAATPCVCTNRVPYCARAARDAAFNAGAASTTSAALCVYHGTMTNSDTRAPLRVGGMSLTLDQVPQCTGAQRKARVRRRGVDARRPRAAAWRRRAGLPPVYWEVGLGKTVQKLTKHQDVQVAQSAQAVCAYWRSLMPRRPGAHKARRVQMTIPSHAEGDARRGPAAWRRRKGTSAAGVPRRVSTGRAVTRPQLGLAASAGAVDAADDPPPRPTTSRASSSSASHSATSRASCWRRTWRRRRWSGRSARRREARRRSRRSARRRRRRSGGSGAGGGRRERRPRAGGGSCASSRVRGRSAAPARWRRSRRAAEEAAPRAAEAAAKREAEERLRRAHQHRRTRSWLWPSLFDAKPARVLRRIARRTRAPPYQEGARLRPAQGGGPTCMHWRGHPECARSSKLLLATLERYGESAPHAHASAPRRCPRRRRSSHEELFE